MLLDAGRILAILILVLSTYFTTIPELFPQISVWILCGLSGYLLSRSLERHSSGVIGFFKRRFLSIYPALIFVIIWVLIYGTFFTIGDEYSDLAKHTLWTYFGLENVENLVIVRRFFDNDFNLELDFNPLYHLIPFGAGVQFTLLWTLIYSSAKKKYGRHFWSLSLFIFLASSGISLVNSEQRIVTGLYWPFALGTLIYEFKRTDSMNSPLPLRKLATLTWPFFLWHWPLLSFYKYLFQIEFTVFDKILLLLATGLLAWFTEQMAARFSFRNLLVSSGLVISACVVIILGDGCKNRFPETVYAFRRIEDYDFMNGFWPEELCPRHRNIMTCNIADPAKAPTVALLGDAHARHWYPGMAEYYKNRGDNLLLLGNSRTPPFVDVRSGLELNTDQSDILRIAMETPSIHTVILAAFWPVYANREGVMAADERLKITIWDESPDGSRDQPVAFAKTLIKTLEAMKRAGKNVIIVHDVPFLPFFPKRHLPRPFMEETYVHCLHQEDLCLFETEKVQREQQLYRAILTHILKDYPWVKTLDPVPHLCDQRPGGYCRIHKKGTVVYWDEHSLNELGSEIITPFLYQGN